MAKVTPLRDRAKVKCEGRGKKREKDGVRKAERPPQLSFPGIPIL